MKNFLLLLLCFSPLFLFAQQPFITTWEVEAGNLEITIPTNTEDYTYDYTVDFGDSTILNNQTGDVTHTYASPGVYTVGISGVFPHFYSQGFYAFNNQNEKLKTVEQWGDNQWLSMEGAFHFCVSMNLNTTDIPDLSQVTSTASMFSRAFMFNYNINNWDTSSVSNMKEMFAFAEIFNQPLDNWDTSSVTDMSSMFNGAKAFNRALNNWNTSSVTNMSEMFMITDAFNQPLDNWDTSNVSNMEYVFFNADVFNEALHNWDTSNVTSMFQMFSFTDAFNQPLNNWDTSNVTNMVGMFSYADVFNQPLHNWNVSNVEFMNSMFANAQAFNQPLNNWDVSNVEFMNSMFANAQAFNQPLNNWNTSSVVQMQHMFRNSQTFDQPLNNWDISNVAVFFKMFSGASAFNQDLSDWNIQGSNLSNFIGNSGMDAINYDLLIEKLVYQGYSNGTLGAESIKYCDAFKRLQLLNAGWTITDGGQAQDCNLNYVSGNVFYDALNDGCNPNDVEIPNYFVNVSNGSEETSFFIDEDGQYAIGLESGDYTLSVLKPNFTSSPTTQSVSFTGQDEILEDIDFCITANQQFEDLSVDIFPLEDAIPGFETDCQIIVANNGTQIEPNVQVSFEYDDNSQSFVSSTTIPTGNSSNLLTFEIVDLEPFSQDVFEITMVNAVPPTLNGGEVLSFTTQVTPDNNDNNIKDNVATHDQTVVNSYDPNDKMVVQGEQILDEDIDQYMDYRIRFQNLGTANALNVKITDTIDNHLDWTTFQPLSSSHDYRIEIVDGEQINYYFDNINLPFEDADPEGSNGYITYKIKPKPSVQIGDTFENTAYIYFDFNLPIITNTVVTTVVDELSIDGFDLSRIKIYPNPVKEKLNLSIPFEVNLNAVELFDIQGKLIKSFENKNELDFSSIQKGIYILRLDTDKGVYNYKVIKS